MWEEHDDMMRMMFGAISEKGIFREWPSIMLIMLSCLCEVAALVPLTVGNEAFPRCDGAA